MSDPMRQLAASLPQPTSLSTRCDPSERETYAAERASLLFKQYRKGEANDPKIYTASVAAILSDYPQETIDFVTDPRTGIAANPIDPKWTGLPDIAHVKTACERHDTHRQRALARERREEEQTRERLAAPGKYLGGKPQQRTGLITFQEFQERGGIRPIGYFEDPNRLQGKPLGSKGETS